MPQMKKIGKHATKVYRYVDPQDPAENRIDVKYHDTVILTVGDGWVRLNSGGWQTVSTKTRMNQAANEFGLDFCVHQTYGVWYVTWITTNRHGDAVTTTAKFFDGMHIWPRGEYYEVHQENR